MVYHNRSIGKPKRVPRKLKKAASKCYSRFIWHCGRWVLVWKDSGVRSDGH